MEEHAGQGRPEEAADPHRQATGHGEGGEPPVPAEELLGVAREAADRLGSVGDSREGLWRLAEKQVEELLDACEQVRRAQERVVHAVVRESLSRGMHTRLNLTVAEFVAVHCPWLPAAEQRRIARVAQAADRAGFSPVVEAVAEGRVCTERADRLLSQLGRLRRYVDEGQCAEYATMLLPLAEMGADRQLRIAVEHLLALVTPEQDAEALAKARQESCKVYESSLADGMKRFIIEADPEGAALLRSVFSSPLTRPEDDGSGADVRPAGRRRYDALTAVVRRGMATPDPEAPAAAPVQMLVTLPFDVLAGRVGAYGTAELGAGELECLTPGQLRRLACEAEMVPFVLGGRSEVLDAGRSRRCASPGQRRALWIRDGACTFPGCSMPAQWTEVHHARVWWSRGGLTDLGDMALLCRRHHTWVHAHDPEVTMTTRGPIWHLDRCHGTGTGERATLHTDRPPPGSGGGADTDHCPSAGGHHSAERRGRQGGRDGRSGAGEGGAVAGRRQPARARTAGGVRVIRRPDDTSPAPPFTASAGAGEQGADRRRRGTAEPVGDHCGSAQQQRAGRPDTRTVTDPGTDTPHGTGRRHRGGRGHRPSPGSGRARPPPPGPVDRAPGQKS